MAGGESANLNGANVLAVEALNEKLTALRREIQKRVIGQDEVVRHLLVGMLARGHCLMIGVPGLAKTLLVSTLARALMLRFSRIQFTPDLMPSDITGTEVMDEEGGGKRTFRFVPGPVFGNVILADEINRTPPKTQSALLQAMQEYRVTCAGKDHPIDPPFFVLATQNPIEQEGTYPLPEAQLDRFMLNIHIGYPSLDEEREILRHTTVDTELEIAPVVTGPEILRFQGTIRRVPVSQHVFDYALRLVRASRPGTPESPQFVRDWVSWGAGPRAAQHLILASKANSVLDGRFAASCDDVRRMLVPVLRHRVFTNFNADAEGVSPADVLRQLVETVPEPSEQDYVTPTT